MNSTRTGSEILPKEVWVFNKPVFKKTFPKIAPNAIREVYIAPETCNSHQLTVFLVRQTRLKDDSTLKTFDIHEGLEEAFYVIKGRMRILTPNENVIVEEGGWGWVPAGMPHRGEQLTDEVISLAIYGPARRGQQDPIYISPEEAKKKAKEVTDARESTL